VLKNVESGPELLILEVMGEIFTEAHSWCFTEAQKGQCAKPKE
jgi:hypothetical protein